MSAPKIENSSNCQKPLSNKKIIVKAVKDPSFAKVLFDRIKRVKPEVLAEKNQSAFLQKNMLNKSQSTQIIVKSSGREVPTQLPFSTDKSKVNFEKLRNDMRKNLFSHKEFNPILANAHSKYLLDGIYDHKNVDVNNTVYENVNDFIVNKGSYAQIGKSQYKRSMSGSFDNDAMYPCARIKKASKKIGNKENSSSSMRVFHQLKEQVADGSHQAEVEYSKKIDRIRGVVTKELERIHGKKKSDHLFFLPTYNNNST